jgi:excisionase family DNA binding protein
MSKPDQLAPDVFTPEDAEALLKPSRVARDLAVTSRYVLLLAERGRLACVRIGTKAVRFRRQDVEAFVNAHRHPASETQTGEAKIHQ